MHRRGDTGSAPKSRKRFRSTGTRADPDVDPVHPRQHVGRGGPVGAPNLFPETWAAATNRSAPGAGDGTPTRRPTFQRGPRLKARVAVGRGSHAWTASGRSGGRRHSPGTSVTESRPGALPRPPGPASAGPATIPLRHLFARRPIERRPADHWGVASLARLGRLGRLTEDPGSATMG